MVQLWYHQVIQERGGYRPYIQLTRLELRAVPLALTRGVSSQGAAARSITIIIAIREVQEMTPSAHVPAIGTGELAHSRCW